MKSEKIFSAIATFIGTALVLFVVGWLFWQLISPLLDNVRNRDNNQVVLFHDFFELEADEIVLLWQDDWLREYTPIFHDGEVYLPLAFIRDFIDPFMFWDTGAQTLFVSTRYEMQSFRVGDVQLANGNVYVPASLVMGLYALMVYFYTDTNVAHVLPIANVPGRFAHTGSGQTAVRHHANTAAPIAVNLPQESTVALLYEEALWTRVRTANGIMGYVLTSALDAEVQPPALPANNRLPLFGRGHIDNFVPRTPNWDGGKINLAWLQIDSADDNEHWMEAPLPANLTVVSPSWFRFGADAQGLESMASATFVQWAQAQGIQVWPNVSDVYNALQSRDSGPILADMQVRQRIIEQLENYVSTLGLDGLVINIESLGDARYGAYYVQFMRELNLVLGHHVIIASAMKEDPETNPHYRHDLIAKTADFIVLMTFDEHHGASPQAGPVASLPWVERQITMMLDMVPPNQLIMGLPYYNRVWRTTVVEGARRTSLNWTIDRVVEEVYERNLTHEWNATVGSYYVTWIAVVEGEALRHQLWQECPRSIAEKMQIYTEHNLAGIAGWNLNFTNDAMWDVLAPYFPMRAVVADE
ncbi:MAG: glycosyl hydrolase family 18 protein [Defluviitaleaceae bacterium]|nr:glycosyl hydrolase family 18 protein [Defluviitaleaceae bacterium]